MKKSQFDLKEIEKMEPKPKRFKQIVDSNSFDIVGTLITEMGLTGENLTRQIFSYLDMTSLVCVRKVSTTWHRFMIRQKSIWMEELRKFDQHLECIENSLLSNPNRKRREKITWDILEKRNVGVMESVYLDIQCLVAFHHIYYRIPFEHYMADCYIGKAMKKQITMFVKSYQGKSDENRSFIAAEFEIVMWFRK